MVSIKRKVTLRTKVTPEKASEPAESPKVSLKKKQAETDEASAPKPRPREVTQPAEKSPGTGKLAASVAAAAIVIAGAFFLINKNVGDGEAAQDNHAGNTLVAQNEAATEPAQEAEIDNAMTKPEEGAPAQAEPQESGTTSEEKTISSTAEQTTQPKAQPHEERKQARQTEPTKSTATSSPDESAIEAKAKQVIRGDFGNGQERKERLGSDYAEIQGKVNDMYRMGLVH